MERFMIWSSVILIIAAFGLTAVNSLEDFGSRFVRSNKKILRKSEEVCMKYGAGYQRKVFHSKYVQPGEFQHNVAPGFEKTTGEKEVIWAQCTGVLISEYYVLTVAHCFIRRDGKKAIMVRLGNVDITGEADEVLPQDIAIAEIIVHPKYSVITKEGDIALVRLQEPAKFDRYVQPACLYTKPDVPITMMGTGWGRLVLFSSEFADVLLKVNVRGLDNESCAKVYNSSRSRVHDTQLCGTYSSTDVCHLGSGSSLFVPNGEDSRVTVVGITSFGKGCSNMYPEVYTRIYSYLSWIEDIVWPEAKSDDNGPIWSR